MLKVCFLLFLVLVALLGLEGLTRVLFYWNSSPKLAASDRFVDPGIPGVNYLLKPHQLYHGNFWTLQTNSLGLREELEPKVQGPIPCRKILVVGSSYSMGYGVPVEKSIPKLLQSTLNNNTKTCTQFINASLEGLTLVGKYGLLQYLLPLYQPDQVVLEINSYDLDDPRRVVNEAIEFDSLAGANHEWLKIKWNLSRRYLDLQNANFSFSGYDPESNSSEPGWAESLFSSVFSNFSLFQFGRNLFLALDDKYSLTSKKSSCQTRDCIEIIPKHESSSGRRVNLPPFSALYYSPKYKKRAANYISMIEELCQRENLPLQIWNLDLDLDQIWTPKTKNTLVLNWEDLLQEPFESFRVRYGLPQDIHLTPAGNKILADRLRPYFEESKDPPPPPPLRSPEALDYWRTEEIRRRGLARRFSSSIDLLYRKATHQIIGGVPVDLFFSPTHQSFHFLLKAAACKSIRLWGNNQAVQAVGMGVQIEHGEKIESHRVQATPQKWEARLPCNLNLKGSSDWIDLDIYCTREECRHVQLWGLEIQ